MKRTALTVSAVCGILLTLVVPTFAAAAKLDSINQGEINFYTVVLEQGITYTVTVTSDTRNCDLDLYIFDSDSDICAQDCSSGSDCVVQYTPMRTQTVTLAVHAHSGDAGYLLAVTP